MKYSRLSLMALVVIAATAGAQRSSAQPTPPEFEYLLTEADVTLTYALRATRSVTSGVSLPAGGTQIRNSDDPFSVTQVQILRSLQLQSVIPAAPAITNTSANGWSLKAVRPPASDIAFVDARHDFYAVNKGANIRVKLNPSSLNIIPKYSTYAYTEQTVGAYTVRGNGTTSNYIELVHNLQFERAGSPALTYTINSLSWGNAAISFRNIDEPVFYFPVSSLRLTGGIGEFSGTSSAPANVAGLATFTFIISTPTLVYASDYPATSVENVETNNPFPRPVIVTP